ncbi:MAG: hypothetical protein KUG76_08275 [Gammaproteobacteria bacterium]|nr:hypothetical protein [Gammaproteobacteria bacterium]
MAIAENSGFSALINKTINNKTGACSELADHIMLLAQNMSGIETVIETPSELPINQITTLLINSNFWPPETRPYYVRRQISNLSAFYYRLSGDEEQWNPLFCSRQAFIQRNQKVNSWLNDTPYPPPDNVMKWLK